MLGGVCTTRSQIGMMDIIKPSTLAAKASQVAVLSAVRNEIQLIGAFFRHYRSIGVDEFHIVDNGSTDGTLEFCLSQPDCHVYSTADSYLSARYGLDWIEELAIRHCSERWALYADCDEHFIYPGFGQISVHEFAQVLHQSGHNCCYAIMLDMYADKDIADEGALQGDDPTESFRYFDSDYRVRWHPLPPWSDPQDAPLQVLGGPRVRLLSDMESEWRRDGMDYFWLGKIDRLIAVTPTPLLRRLFATWPNLIPALHKTPLNFISGGFRYYSAHNCSNSNSSPSMACHLHYKFVNELVSVKASSSLQLNHYRRGLEREQLRRAILRAGSTLIYPGSQEYTGRGSLERAGLLGDHFAHVLGSRGKAGQ